MNQIVMVSASDYLTHTRYVLEFSPFYLVPISFFSRSHAAWHFSGVAVPLLRIDIPIYIEGR
jgi:hypothetical protein